jgi:hypothetical protein
MREPASGARADEVARRSDDATAHWHAIASAAAGFAQAADGLHPAERFLHPLSDPPTERITRMARGARLIARHLRSDLERATGRDEVTGPLSAPNPIRWDPGRRSSAIAGAARRAANPAAGWTWKSISMLLRFSISASPK